MNDKNYPTHFKLAKEILNKLKNKEDIKIKNCLNRFIYRYRMAKAFIEARYDGVDNRTVNGYNAGMHLFLAYSAFDEIRNVEMLLLKKRRLKIHNLEKNLRLCNSIRKNKSLKHLLLNSISIHDGGLSLKINEFYGVWDDKLGQYIVKNNDLLVFATCLRNCYVHGDFTANGAGLTNASKLKAISDLTNEILNYCDELLTKLVKE